MKHLAPALLILVLAGCSSYAPRNAESVYREKKPVAAEAVRRDVAGFVTLAGRIVIPPEDQAEVYAAYRAPVERVLATVGQRVGRGEVLIELSFPNAEAAYEQARVNVEAAESAYNAALAQYGAEYKAALDRVAAARKEERLARALTKEGAEADLQAKTDIRVAAEADAAQAKAARDTAVLPYKQQLETVRAEFEAAKAGAKMASIRAPISGTVLMIEAQPGQEIGVDPRKPVARIVDLSNVHIHVPLEPDDSTLLKPKMTVSLTFKDIPNKTFEGRVWKISTLPDPQTKKVQLEAIIDVKNEDGLIKPGMTDAAVVIKTGQVEDVVTVPAEAVDRDADGKPIVNVKSGEKWLPTMVEVGLSDGEYTEIKSGVKEGDTVLVTPDDK